MSDHHKLAAAKSLQVRRKNRLIRELQRVPSLTRDQRAEVITAAASIPVEEYPGQGSISTLQRGTTAAYRGAR